MFKLINKSQNYSWGSKTLLCDMFGVNNPNLLPIAEIWMGAHPKSSSLVQINEDEQSKLNDLIEGAKEKFLGIEIAERYGELPFLFKVLCADKALSIQVHPSKIAAEIGFNKENSSGLPINSPNRNYKDSNHKPELIFAITPFRAMNAFRDLSEIVELLKPVSEAHVSITNFIKIPNYETLRILFDSLLNLQGEEKDYALSLLKSISTSQQGVAWRTIQELVAEHPDDSGLFMPLLLNIIELKPGEAMFLNAETPHAYFKGVGLEVMANSDNVLRAGLTSKHIDVHELLANVDFKSVPYNLLKTPPKIIDDVNYFPVPVDDFSFSIHSVGMKCSRLNQNGPAILFCISGKVVCTVDQQSIVLVPGDSVFIGANENEIILSGDGCLARAYAEI